MGFTLSKVEIVKDRILQDIAAGRKQPGDALPSRPRCARDYNCSRTTIDQAVRELTAAGRLFSSRGAGTFVAKNRQAGKLERAYLIDDFSRREHADAVTVSPIAAEIQRSAICRLARRSEIKLYLNELIQPGSAAIWRLPSPEDFAVIGYLRGAGTPQLLIGRSYPRYNYISTDADAGVRDGLRWLRDRGRRRIAFVGPTLDPALPYIAERLIAFYQGCAELGITVIPELVGEIGPDRRAERFNALANRLFAVSGGADGVVFSRGDAVMPLLSLAENRGRRLGQDFDVYSFDPIQEFRDVEGVAMSQQQWEKMGELAVRWFFHDAIRGENNLALRVPPLFLAANEAATTAAPRMNNDVCSSD